VDLVKVRDAIRLFRTRLWRAHVLILRLALRQRLDLDR